MTGTTSETVERLERVASWLALSDPMPDRVDLMLLFGGSLPPAWDAAAAAVLEGRVGTLMVVGGRGHTTDAMLDLLGRPRGLLEAEVILEHLERVHGLREVLVEPASRNCGENVVLARQVAAAHGLLHREADQRADQSAAQWAGREADRRTDPRVAGTVALVQDPSMQRRMDAVFRLVWPDAVAVNRPGPPHDPAATYAWPHDRWVALVMGEPPRLRDDEHGYGPRGAAFMAHVDVPPEIEADHAELLATHPEWGRPALGQP